MIATISFFSELRYKEVIDIHSGFRLGYVCDAEYDDAEGRILSLITPGHAKFFGLFGRGEDFYIPWDCVTRFGDDIILIDKPFQRRGEPPRQRRGRF